MAQNGDRSGNINTYANPIKGEKSIVVTFLTPLRKATLIERKRLWGNKIFMLKLREKETQKRRSGARKQMFLQS